MTGTDRARIDRLLAAAGLRDRTPAGLERLGGTGNLTYLVTLSDRMVVVRLPGGETGGLVDRAAERHNAAVAAGLGIGPTILHVDPADGAMVLAHVSGTPLAELAGAPRLAALGRLGAALARLHRGPSFRGLMDPWQKIALYLRDAGCEAETAFGPLWARIAPLRERVVLDPARLAPCHVDPVPDNVLDTGSAVVLLDWEYAAMSEPLWDLAYACVEGGLDTAGEDALLAGYGPARVEWRRLAEWKLLARVVSAAWCMARAALAGEAMPMWRREVEIRLAAIARALDDPAHRQD